MEDGVAAFPGQYALQLIEILHGAVNALDELSVAALTEVINGTTRLGLERQRIALSEIDKPAVERPTTLLVGVVVPLLVERTGRLDITGPCDAHQFLASGCRVLRMLQHMGGIHVVKRFVLEREGFHRRE